MAIVWMGVAFGNTPAQRSGAIALLDFVSISG
jgi:hypothetical protein